MNYGLEQIWATLRDMLSHSLQRLPQVTVAILVFAIFYGVGRLTKFIIRRATQNRLHTRNVGIVTARLSYAALLLVGLLIAIAIVAPSFKAANLIQLLGIGSVAVGFAFRDVLQNFLAGILLLWNQPFRIGDQIVLKQFEGTVEDIQTRATTMVTYDGRRVVIPNAELFTNSVTVNTAYEKRRSEYDVGIGVSDDLDRSKELILEAVRSVKDVLDDPPPSVFAIDLADFSVKIRIWWWTAPPRREQMFITKDQVITAIKKTLIENGIDLPYPTQQILFHDQTEETDGDRSRQREGWPAGTGQVPKPRTIARVLRKVEEEKPLRRDREPAA